MIVRQHTERISIRLGAWELQQIEALAELRGVSVSACIRSMLDHFLADDGGRAAELARISKMLRKRSPRARRA